LENDVFELFFFFSAKAALRCIVVVFPTPPFSVMIEITFVFILNICQKYKIN